MQHPKCRLMPVSTTVKVSVLLHAQGSAFRYRSQSRHPLLPRAKAELAQCGRNSAYKPNHEKIGDTHMCEKCLGPTRRDLLMSGAALATASATGVLTASSAAPQSTRTRDFSTSIAQIDAYMGAPVERVTAANGAITNKRLLDGIDTVAWPEPTIEEPAEASGCSVVTGLPRWPQSTPLTG